MRCKHTVFTCGLLISVFGSSAVLAEDKTLGAEFIDMPEDYQAPVEEEVDESDRPAYVPGYRDVPSVGLSQYAPQHTSALPGAVTPAYGSPVSTEGWRFDFSGYLQQPVVMSVGKREGGGFVGQGNTTLHGDPVLPGSSYGWFDHSQTVPGPWTQLNFHYGNDVVKATAIIGSWRVGQAMDSSNYWIPPSQLWFNDAFMTYTPDIGAARMKVLVGAYPDRYGPMAKWHSGAYGLAFMGELRGMGTTSTITLPFENDVTFGFEAGFKGQWGRAPSALIPDSSNEYPLQESGSTYGAHGHFSASYESSYTVSAHYVRTWSQDDRIDDAIAYDDDTTQPYPMDGFISVTGVDLRADLERFGYFYGGVAQLQGENAMSVTNLLKFLNAGGGKELNDNFFGFASNGNGKLTVIGAQYSLSLGTLLRYPMEFWGDGPDLEASIFGIYGEVSDAAPAFNTDMFKWGTEWTYSMTPWFAAAFRVDHISPDARDTERAFWVLSPKLIFRTDWKTREALTLQYAGYVLGDNTRVEGDTRLRNTISGNPDQHMVSAFVTMWW
jgi:hypothetical protein